MNQTSGALILLNLRLKFFLVLPMRIARTTEITVREGEKESVTI